MARDVRRLSGPTKPARGGCRSALAASLKSEVRDLVESTKGPPRWILTAFVLLQLTGVLWDQPGFYGWENDGVAPRDFLFALKHHFTPGQTHRYPLFHSLLVGIVASPVLLVDLAIAWFMDRPTIEVVFSVPSMTAIALVTKMLHVAMTVIGLAVLSRLWTELAGRQVAIWALLFAGTNLTVVYYGRVTNADTAYAMWTLLALDRIVRLARDGGATQYRWLALFIAAGLATKDQAYAAFVLVGLVYLAALPAVRSTSVAAGAQHFRRLGQSALLGLGAYLVLSGAVFNPTGFWSHVELLLGTNSADWRQYSLSGAGLVRNVRDVVLRQPDYFWPWPVLVVAWVGVVLVVVRRVPAGESTERRMWPGPLWRLLPLIAGVSAVVAFTLVVGRREHRFLLILGYGLSGYVGLALVEFGRGARSLGARSAEVVVGGALVMCGLSQNLELLVTQWMDPRRQVEAFVDNLPSGARVETYGLGVYLPRFDLGPDARYRTTRVRAPEWRRSPFIPGISEVADDLMEYERRRPDVIVVSEGFYSRFKTAGHRRKRRGAMRRYLRGRGAMTFFTHIQQGGLPGYRLHTVGQLRRPRWYAWLGGRLLRIHGSTGREVRVFVRERARNEGELRP